MKTLRMVGMALFAVLMCVNFASCSNDENGVPQDGEEIVVSLGFGGDFEISESPLSRVSANDLFAIHASVQDKNNGNALINYATGLFDDADKIKIKLQKDDTYSFSGFVIKDGKIKLQQPTSNAEYTYPLYAYTLNNEFGYPGAGRFDITYTGFVLADEQCYRIPNLDVYVYEEEVEYSPQTDKGAITIPMRRWTFGTEFIATGLADDETLTVRLEQSDSDELQYYTPTVTLNNSDNTSDDVYFFPAFLAEEQDRTKKFESVKLYAAFYLNEELIARPEITFKRNKKTTIKIDVEKTSIGFDYETSDLGDGGTYNVNGDTATEE